MPKARRKTGERSRVSPDPGLGSPDNAFHPFSSVGLDIILNCAVRAREFLLPHLSFKDLFSLERTSKVLRDIIREKQLWRILVEKFRRQDKAGDRLLACYSPTSRTASHPDYFRKLAMKYLSDTSKINGNIRERSFRMHCMKFGREITSRDAFTFHENGQTAMILNGDNCDVLALTANKSKRGVEVTLLRSFPTGFEQLGERFTDGVSLLASSGDLLFHVEDRGCRVWNWRLGRAVEIAAPKKRKKLLGLGFPTLLAAQDDFLMIGSSSGSLRSRYAREDGIDREEDPGRKGEALIHIWKVSLDAAGRRIYFSPFDQIARHADEKARMKFTEADSDKNILVASGTNSKTIYIYDLKSKILLGRRYFGAFVRGICVNASLMRAVVALAPDYESSSYVNDHAVIVDLRTGNKLRVFQDDDYAPHDNPPDCVWTDWKRYVITGGWRFSLVWNINPVDDIVADHNNNIKNNNNTTTDDDTDYTDDDETAWYYRSDRFPILLGADTPFSPNIVLTRIRFSKLRFDGKYLFAYTRPHGTGEDGAKPAVRVIDFLKLSSTKF